MKIYKHVNNLFILTSLFLILISSAQAQLKSGILEGEIDDQTAAFSDEAGFDSAVTIGQIVPKVIEGFLGLLAVIFIILIIIAGYNWMTAQGDEAKVTKAKDSIQKAIIGIIIILAAYSITYFVFNALPFGGTGGSGVGVPGGG